MTEADKILIALPGWITEVVIQSSVWSNITIRWVVNFLPTELPSAALHEIEDNIPLFFASQLMLNFTTAQQDNEFKAKMVKYFLFSYGTFEAVKEILYPKEASVRYYNWNGASKLCKYIGGSLPVISNRLEQIQLVSLVKLSPTFRPSEVLFIGLIREVTAV